MAAICAGIASGAWARVGTDEDFKMAVRAKSVIPALADRLALAARAGEADGRADTRGQGGASSASNKGAMPAATRLSQLSRLPCVIVLLPSNRLSGDGQAIGQNTDAQERQERGAAGNCGSGGRALRANPVPNDCRCWEEGGGTSYPHTNQSRAGARRHGKGLYPLPRAKIVTLTRQGLLRTWSERSRGDRDVSEGTRPILFSNL